MNETKTKTNKLTHDFIKKQVVNLNEMEMQSIIYLQLMN